MIRPKKVGTDNVCNINVEFIQTVPDPIVRTKVPINIITKLPLFTKVVINQPSVIQANPTKHAS